MFILPANVGVTVTHTPRELIALSDGTGNSASKPFKTNVWRLYQALNLRDGSQVAVFGDGVGTSSINVLRILGLALGIGVKRNVLNLYKFLCHNYWRAEDEKVLEPGEDRSAQDRIWMFGFSRGAFTVRLLAGLVHSQGLVRFETEADLDRFAVRAYRAFRKEAFPAKWRIWVWLGREIRDLLVFVWDNITGTPYSRVKRRQNITIHFIGVWDTVAAYGLPIDELTIAVDQWIWPMNFAGRDTTLSPRVTHARHALALDDERRTFHPIPWDEHHEKATYGRVDPNRLTQVWFPGMHSDVGGGYPDDGLSFVPLCWMIDEARKNNGLRFENAIVETYRALASPTGRLYDSRSGLGGALWRYQPRNVQLLMDNRDESVLKQNRITPLVHHSTITRMTYGNDGYAPKSLPFKIDILLPNDERVGFNKQEVDNKLKTVPDTETRRVLTDLKALIATTSAADKRGFLFALVIDTIWWRRLVYFVTLGLALFILAFPVAYTLVDWGDKTAKINQIPGGTIHWLLTFFKGFIPSYASPWIDAVSAAPQVAVNVVLGFFVSLVISKFLALRIKDRARAAWNVQPRVGDDEIKRLRLAGQRHALFVAFIIFGLVAWFSWPNCTSSAVAAVLSVGSLLMVILRRKEPKTVDPEHPPILLQLARSLRDSWIAVRAYRALGQFVFPALFIIVVLCLALSGLNLGLYNARSTDGQFCEIDKDDPTKSQAQRKREAQERALNDKLGSAGIDISSPCARTHLWLVAGRQYRIQIEPGVGETAPGMFEKRDEFAWFDKGTPADVVGFGINSRQHFLGMTLKRWWRENYFQPVARIGNIGNYEYPLKPAAPLPKVIFPKDCAEIAQNAGPRDVRSPAPVEARKAALKCEADAGVHRNELLIADITPDSTGELYIYVNDSVLFWDRADDHRFYKNNSGKAKVTVTRTLAPSTIDAKEPAQGALPK